MKIMNVFVMLLLLLMSCIDNKDSNNNNNPVSPANERYFALYFDVDNYDGDTNVDVEFYTSDVSIVPTVTINGINIEYFQSAGGVLLGELNNLPYSNSFNYNVSVNDKTTSGSISMPSEPYNVMCNGANLNEDEASQFSTSSSFNFTWNCTDYNYFLCSWDGQDWKEEYTTNTYITFNPDGSNYYYFEIASYKGALLIPGTGPNVSGDYGKGYVVAESDRKGYTISISTAMTKIMPFNDDRNQRSEEIKRKIVELITR